MRQPALVLATVAALSFAAPAKAAIVTSNYSFVTGAAGSGTFSVNFDTGTGTYSLSAFNYALGSTTFTTANVSLQQTGGFNFVIGGNTIDAATVTSLAGQDDFSFGWAPVVFPPTVFTYYIAGGILPVQTTNITLALVETPAGVPEPATWAMMLLGFAGIGIAIRRGRKVVAAT